MNEARLDNAGDDWRADLRHKVVWLVAIKLVALGLLWWWFFSPPHRIDAGCAQTAQQLAVDQQPRSPSPRERERPEQ